MAFGVKYRIEFRDQQNSQLHRVDILMNDYAGSVITLRPVESIFEIKYNQSSWVVGSEAIFSFIANASDLTSLDNDFYNALFRDIKLRFYIEIESSFVLKWVGWLKPENTSRQYLYPEVIYKISAT